MPRVRNKGRVAIPESVRTALGIEPGDDVVFEETDAGYVLRKQDPQPSEGEESGVE
jgi:AbrB family looped-hinge helix DNA binding protein